MFRRIDPACPFHPIVERSHTKQERDNARQRAEDPGWFTKKEGTKYIVCAPQCADTGHEERAEQHSHNLPYQSTRNSPVTV